MASVISFPEQVNPVTSVLEALTECKSEIDSLAVVFRTKEGEYSLMLSTFDIEMMATAQSVINAELMINYLLSGDRDAHQRT